MPHTEDNDDEKIVFHAIDDAIVAHSNAIVSFSASLHGDDAVGPGIIGKSGDPSVDTHSQGGGKVGDLPLRGRNDQNAIRHSNPMSLRTLA